MLSSIIGLVSLSLNTKKKKASAEQKQQCPVAAKAATVIVADVTNHKKMKRLENIYSENNEIIAQVNIETKQIIIDKSLMTDNTIYQSYCLYYIIENWNSKLIQFSLKKFGNLSELSKIISENCLIQGGETLGKERSVTLDFVKLTSNELALIVTDCFLSRTNLTI